VRAAEEMKNYFAHTFPRFISLVIRQEEGEIEEALVARLTKYISITERSLKRNENFTTMLIKAYNISHQ